MTAPARSGKTVLLRSWIAEAGLAKRAAWPSLTEEMIALTDSNPAGSAPREEEPTTSWPAEEPAYLTETGEAVGEDGSVAPIIGGLPAVEGSSWDIGDEETSSD